MTKKAEVVTFKMHELDEKAKCYLHPLLPPNITFPLFVATPGWLDGVVQTCPSADRATEGIENNCYPARS